MAAHANRAHALLSASGAKRWMSCTPSARAEEAHMQVQYANGKTEAESEYAKEGTEAHEYSEILLKRELGELTRAQATRQINKFIKNAKFYNEEMQENVSSYVDFVMERVNAARSVSADALVLIEQKLDFSHIVPEGFGTGDVTIVYDGFLELIDLKYGKGIPVSAEWNPQLMLYGIGAIATHDILYGIETVQLTIVQPRLDSISTFEITSEELLEWAENEVKPRAALADAGGGDFVPGGHCQFCKIKNTCRARSEQALEMAKAEFEDDGSIEIHTPEPAELTPEEMSELLFIIDDIEKWCKDVKNYALQSALDGEKYDGFKLVEGRSLRKITNSTEAITRLKEAGYAEADILKPQELRGITDLEKLIGKTKFSELLAELITKPPGKAALVPSTDKRPELNSFEKAEEEFSDLLG